MKIESGSFLGRPPTAAISSVERAYRISFPKDYLRFLDTYNGAVPVDLCVEIDGHERLIVFFLSILDRRVDVGEAWVTDISTTLAQIGARLVEDSDKDKVGLKLIPFAALFGGDYLCLDFRNNYAKPSVAYWDHASTVFQPITSHVALSFGEFCKGLGMA
ncbi:SMI1/KNR4 family protein [Paraburkholderia sp. JHI869]|uniref:SMI1/KNR4 family protein n=1 Tax=Paraburkholderia sp. JHI869 TaxID=3112959 RepID=UPI00317169D8